MPDTIPQDVLALANARKALKLVAANLPHLSGLCQTVRIRVTKKYPVAAIGASGLMLVNPHVFTESPISDLVFVVAHELLHLALDTFGRGGNAKPMLVNVAHDYIINDILAVELNRTVPLGGLVWEGARRESLEAIVTKLAQNGSGAQNDCWSIGRKRKTKGPKPPKSAMRDALEKAGLLPPEPEEEGDGEDEPDEYPSGDALTAEEEGAFEPELGPKERTGLRERVRREAVRAASLRELRDQMAQSAGGGWSGTSDPGATETFMDAVQTAYQPPWQLALQHWLDAVTPGPRSFAKPSRRSGDRTDGVILPGRKREGWALHVVMDTSGSMIETLPHILGLLASFCEGAGVGQVHILQCDVGVTADEWLDPAELQSYKVTGFGGSDMSPGMDQLAEDPEVSAVLVLTDGYISFPAEEPPYAVLWGLVDGWSEFRPTYGTVVHVKT
ncbi:MAG TPA: VWA-like domain-containing protein [Gemmataceae bacterium]|nr:VWA-like domain-containing protein [Gemmataceae bacterium]